MEKTTKEGLLIHAASKPIKTLLQFDVFQRANEYYDSFIRPDKDGDCVFGPGGTLELKNIDELRVLIPENRTPEEVMRGLKKVIDCIKRDPACISFKPEGTVLSEVADDGPF